MARGTILVVEDDADQRAALAELLRAEGHRVREAASAEDAIERFEHEAIDLVVADYQLAGATGTWLARIAARTGRTSMHRVIIVTGHEGLADGEGLTVFRKPLDVSRFLDAIGLALRESPRPDGEVPRPSQRIAFSLYLSDSTSSERVQQRLQEIMAGYDVTQIALTVTRLTPETAAQAEEHRIVLTPTLLKTFPAPRVWIAGDLKPDGVVERLLLQAGVEKRS